MTSKPIRPLAWIAFMAFVGSVVGSGIAGRSLDMTGPLIGAAVGAVVGLFTRDLT